MLHLETVKWISILEFNWNSESDSWLRCIMFFLILTRKCFIPPRNFHNGCDAVKHTCKKNKEQHAEKFTLLRGELNFQRPLHDERWPMLYHCTIGTHAWSCTNVAYILSYLTSFTLARCVHLAPCASSTLCLSWMVAGMKTRLDWGPQWIRFSVVC